MVKAPVRRIVDKELVQMGLGGFDIRGEKRDPRRGICRRLVGGIELQRIRQKGVGPLQVPFGGRQQAPQHPSFRFFPRAAGGMRLDRLARPREFAGVDQRRDQQNPQIQVTGKTGGGGLRP